MLCPELVTELLCEDTKQLSVFVSSCLYDCLVSVVCLAYLKTINDIVLLKKKKKVVLPPLGTSAALMPDAKQHL